MADIINEVIEGTYTIGVNGWTDNDDKIKEVKDKQKRISNENTIKLCPLWAYFTSEEDKINETLALPVSPSDMMFTCDSSATNLNLMNYGELPVNMNRKLATWSVSAFFPKQIDSEYYTDDDGKLKAKRNRYWFDLSEDNGQGQYKAYGDYCRILYDWKIDQTPLVYMYPTWGQFYYCQIKTFKYGNKDASGNVYYDLQFQEYKKYDKFDTSYASTDYSSDVYYAAEGDTLISIAKKIYGSTNYYIYLMKLNNMDNPNIVKGQAIKVR